MDLSIYMAFTGAELKEMQNYHGKTAWLGCHLSAYGRSLSPLPASLSYCDMLVLTDETPADSHDPLQIAEEFVAQANSLGCEKVLLDFQRPPTAESAEIVMQVLKSASIPVGVTENYAEAVSCPVFLPPPPLWVPLEEYIAPWKGREIWLETAPEGGCITLKENGSYYRTCDPSGEYPFADKKLHLSYRTEISDSCVNIYLSRAPSLLKHWLELASRLGIHTAVGLYQLTQQAHLHSSEIMV